MPPLWTQISPLGRARQRIFTPASLPGLVLNMDAVSLALSDGTPVGSWPDLTAVTGGFTAAGSARPTYRANQFGALPGVTFDGVANVMSAVNAANVLSGNGCSVVMVFKMTDASADAVVALRLKSATTEYLLGIGKSGNTGFGGGSPYYGYRGPNALAGSSGAFTDGFTGASMLTSTWKGDRQDQAGEALVRVSDTSCPTSIIGFGGSSNASQIGGDSGGAKFFNGTFGQILAYDRPLKLWDARTLWAYLQARWGTPPLAGPPVTSGLPILECDGNSLTLGTGGSSPYPTQLQALLGGAGAWTVFNTGQGGQTTESMVSIANLTVDTLYDATKPKNICVCWEGTNSINVAGDTAAQAYAAMTTYIRGRQAMGFRTIVLTTLPATGVGIIGSFEATRVAYNALVNANTAGADEVVDVAADPRLQNPSDLTYFSSDQIHLNNTGYGVVASLVQPAVLLF